MSKIYKGVSELIGKTPIIEAVNFEKAVEADATILAKLRRRAFLRKAQLL